MPIEPADVTEIADPAVPPITAIKLYEMLNLVMALRTKVDNDWYRVIYLHAALIGVMVFFAEQTQAFLLARLVVFAFYTFNVAVSYAALRDSHAGLSRATADLRSFPSHPGAAGVQDWLASRYYDRAMRLQLWVLGVAWVLVAYLLLSTGIPGLVL